MAARDARWGPRAGLMVLGRLLGRLRGRLRRPVLLDRATGRREGCEEALQVLRGRLEERGLLLAINRYREDAFVSGMARQMSDGLSCYLVRMGRPVRPPRRVVGSLDAAPVRRVATRDEADAYVRRWIESCR